VSTRGQADRDVLAAAAKLMAGGAGDETTEMLLYAAMLEVAEHHSGTGQSWFVAWVCALDALGETCRTIAKRRRISHNKARS
jgi:hypothetical protein